MKNIGNKTLIFYYFQLEANKDYNVTTINNNGQPPTIKDILSILPFDLTQGLYHFRFKSELTDGDQKILAWIDINNIAAKVPQVNGSIYMKILKLKDPSHNKLFHLQKLRKAEIIKLAPNEHHFHSAPKPTPSPHANNSVKSSNNVPINQNVNINSGQNKVEPKQTPQRGKVATSLLEPAHNEPISSQKQKVKQKQPSPPAVPQKPKFVTTTIEQNLQTFNRQFKDEQTHRQNERMAQNEFEDKIRKWGYTDGKKINNTTTLLATLHQMWPQWQPVSLTDMLKPEQVTALFKKAVVKVHPDKNRNRHFKEKYLSKRIFQLLNESRKM